MNNIDSRGWKNQKECIFTPPMRFKYIVNYGIIQEV